MGEARWRGGRPQRVGGQRTALAHKADRLLALLKLREGVIEERHVRSVVSCRGGLVRPWATRVRVATGATSRASSAIALAAIARTHAARDTRIDGARVEDTTYYARPSDHVVG